MISKSEMMPLLLEAYPAFIAHWQSFTEEWSHEKELPIYVIFGDLVRQLSADMKAQKTDEFAAFFQVVERLILEGDQYVSEAAVVGILEDLQNTNLHDGTTPEQFVPYLGSESKYWWDKLNHFWKLGEMLVDDRLKQH